MQFKCLRCCCCCTNLLHKEKGKVMGLSLLPEEATLFPSEHIFPSIGIGKYGQPKRIIAYQLDLNECPYLQGQQCSIYERRPLACRAYPFTLILARTPRFLIDENCKWFKEKVVSNGLEKKVLTPKEAIMGAREEKQAAIRLLELKKEFILSKNKWWFDLSRKAWFSSAGSK